MPGERPDTAAATLVVPVTGEGVASTVAYVAIVGSTPQSKLVAVDVFPTVNVPFNVAPVLVTEVAEFVTTLIALAHCATLPTVNEPPNAASKAASSLASWSLRSAMMSAAGTPAASSLS